MDTITKASMIPAVPIQWDRTGTIFNPTIYIANRSYDKMKEITKTKAALNQIIEIIGKLKEIFADGFQFSDSFKILGMMGEFFTLPNLIKEALLEKDSFGGEEIKALTEEFTAKGLGIFWVNNGKNEAKFGVDNLVNLLDYLSNIVSCVIDAVKTNGIGIDDVRYLPQFVSNVAAIIGIAGEAIKEAGELSAIEISKLLGTLSIKIISLLK